MILYIFFLSYGDIILKKYLTRLNVKKIAFFFNSILFHRYLTFLLHILVVFITRKIHK